MPLSQGEEVALKRLWRHLVQVPKDLSLFDRIYLRGLYLICALIAFEGLLVFIGAFTSNVDVPTRLLLAGASLVCVGAAYALRLFLYWFLSKKLPLLRFLGSK